MFYWVNKGNKITIKKTKHVSKQLLNEFDPDQAEAHIKGKLRYFNGTFFRLVIKESNVFYINLSKCCCLDKFKFIC